MLPKKTNVSAYFDKTPDSLNNRPFYGLNLDIEQQEFRDEIWNPNKLIIFCNAKAGTGKTLIASAVGNLLVKYGRLVTVSVL